MSRDVKAKKRRKKRPDWMRPQVLGSVFILVIMVASLFTFLIPQGGDEQVNGDVRDLQLILDDAGLKDIMAILPSGVDDLIYTDFEGDISDELAIWAASITGAPGENMLGRLAQWFLNANYPNTQGSSSFERIDHWMLLMSFGNDTVYQYPNVMMPYLGINITRHPNFYYTPNTDPVLLAAVENDLHDVLGIWMEVNATTNETAAAEYGAMLDAIPDGADWAYLNKYSNTTSPLNYSDQVFVSITTLEGGEYYLNISSHLRYDGQPDPSRFTVPANFTGDASFTVDGDYAFYGLRAELDVIASEIIRLNVFG